MLWRSAVSSRRRASSSAIEHVSRGRAKRICVEYLARIRAALIADLNRTIKQAEHELTIVHATSLGVDRDEVAALARAVDATKALVAKAD